jgi:hypothetical protein
MLLNDLLDYIFSDLFRGEVVGEIRGPRDTPLALLDETNSEDELP